MISGWLPVDAQAVTFDCWNTLLYEPDWHIAHARRVEALAEAVRNAGAPSASNVVGGAFDVAWRRHMELWEQGAASSAFEIAEWALAELGLDAREVGSACLGPLVTRWQEASHSGAVRALEGAQVLLKALRRRGIATALVCDTGLTPGRVVRRHLDYHGLLANLDAQLFSDEHGAPKPSTTIFHAALEAVGASPERSLHVGDLKRTDVAGARAAGMRTLRLSARYDDPSELPEADGVIASLEELLEEVDALPPAR